jgi:hypothetical protein
LIAGSLAATTGAATLTGFAAAILLGAAGLAVLVAEVFVFGLALTFSAAVLAALAATGRFVPLLATDLAGDLECDFAVGFVAARAALRAAVAPRRVAAVRAAVFAVLAFAVDLVLVVALEVIVLVVLADVFALVFRLEAAVPAGLRAEAARLGDFFADELRAAALLVAPLLAARLASVLERVAEPLARAAAVEAVAGDFFSAFLLEGIRGLLLCCPAVETGPSPPPDESRMPTAKKRRDTAKAASGNLASAAYPTVGPLADPRE